MRHTISSYKKKKWLALGLVSLALVALLIVAACGESATATPEPAATDPAPAPTAAMDEATAAPGTTLRPVSEWTVDNPATHEEIEAALSAHEGGSFTFVSWGGSYQEMQRQAFLIPFAEKFGVNIIEDGPPDYAKVRAMAHHRQCNLGHSRWLRPGWRHHGPRGRAGRARRVHHQQGRPVPPHP